jgi:beta-lactamase regulating signal transducer with metallopeptidase domain
MTIFANLIDPALEFASAGLQLAIDAAFAAGLLAVAVLAVNMLFRRWLSASQMGVLWSLVLVRLLLPWGPPSAVSLQNVWERLATIAAPSESTAEPPSIELRQSQTRTAKFSSNYDAAGKLIYTYAGIDAPTSNAALPAAGANSWSDELLIDSLLLWPAIAGFIVMRTLWTTWRFSRAVRRTPDCDNSRLLFLWKSSCQQAGVRRAIPIVLFDRVRQPAIMGCFHPTLLLPPDVVSLGDEQLQMIMLHELAHVRRWDVALNWGLVLIRAIHWWNPVYWLAASRFGSLREQACDAFVLRRLNGETIANYGNLLLTLAERRPDRQSWRVAIPASILTFISSKFRRRAIGNRLKALRQSGDRRGRWQFVAATLLATVLACCGLTDAKTNSADAESRPSDSVFPVPFADSNLIEPKHSANEATKDQHAPPMPRAAPPSMPRPHVDAVKIECRCISLNRDLKYLRQDLKSIATIDWHYLAPYSPDAIDESTSASTADSKGFRATARVEEYVPVVYSILGPDKAHLLLDDIQNSTHADIVQAPQLLCVSGQQAFIQDVSQHPFVVAVEESQPGMQKPKISMANAGTTLLLRPSLSADRKQIELSGRLEFSSVGEAQTAQVKSKNHPEAEPTEVQVPHVKRYVIDLASEIPSGHSLLIGLLPDDRSKNNMYLLLTPTDADEPETPPVPAK